MSTGPDWRKQVMKNIVCMLWEAYNFNTCGLALSCYDSWAHHPVCIWPISVSRHKITRHVKTYKNEMNKTSFPTGSCLNTHPSPSHRALDLNYPPSSPFLYFLHHHQIIVGTFYIWNTNGCCVWLWANAMTLFGPWYPNTTCGPSPSKCIIGHF